MPELDNARAALQPFTVIAGFTDRLERFEAAVRANERATPPKPMDDAAAEAAIAPLKDAVRRHKARERAEHRTAILREVADRLDADARQGEQDGWMRIYKRGAAKKVREWADEAQQGAEQ